MDDTRFWGVGRIGTLAIGIALGAVSMVLTGSAIAESFPSLAVIDVRQAISAKDGGLRHTYAMSSPEAWLEDVGTAQLSGGSANVALDADFASAVSTDGYHVFLTALGESAGLYATGLGPGGFTVREVGGGKASITFSWRVLAKRKDLLGKRFEPIVIPAEIDPRRTESAGPTQAPLPTPMAPPTSVPARLPLGQ